LRKITGLASGLFLAVCVLSVALAATLYSLSVSNTMRLNVSYELLFETDAHVPVASVDWGGFDHLEAKVMKDVIGVNAVQIKNVGNTAVDVTWSSDLPSGWTLSVVYLYDGTDWISGETKTLNVNTVIDMRITLTEVSASPGVDYSFDLNFDVVD
jgi:hypothetical protein